MEDRDLKTFEVLVTMTVNKTVTVQAFSEKEAMEKGRDDAQITDDDIPDHIEAIDVEEVGYEITN